MQRRLVHVIMISSIMLGLSLPLAGISRAQDDQPRSGIHLPPPEGPWTVYLTFDDGPSRSVTTQILDIMAEYDVQGTFFLHGHRIKGNEDLVQRMIREGHAIGNHLWHQNGVTHGSAVTQAELTASWQKTEDEIVRALGPKLAAQYHDQPVFLIRQPGGSVHPFPLPEGAEPIWYNWHVSSGDSAPYNPGPDDPPERPWNYIVGNVVLSWYTPHRYYSVYDYGDGAIILMHDVAPVLAEALPVIIEDLLANGARLDVLPRPGDAVGSLPVLISAPPEYYGMPKIQIADSAPMP